jgi:DNA-directed RNA polymerase specialized sigma subunit
VLDFNKKDFYSTFDKVLKKQKFYFKVKGKWVDVPKEVYYILFNSYRKELRNIRKENEYRVISYDTEIDDGITLLETIGKEAQYLDTLYVKDINTLINNAIESIGKTDCIFIKQILFEEKREKELAEKYGIRQQSVNKRKKRILNTIRKKLIKMGVK